jgi:hypothetical protein
MNLTLPNHTTPEDRIRLARVNLGRTDDYKHRGISNTPLDYFDTYQQYKKAKNLYWRLMFKYQLSPRTVQVPVFESHEEYVLWSLFQKMMSQKFQRTL